MSTMSSFERYMVNRLDGFAENQRNLHDLCVNNFQRFDNKFDSMDARFMTLDEQIEAVQNQIFDLQYADNDESREKQSVDVSKQPIVFYGCIRFSIFFCFCCFKSDVLRTFIFFISSFYLFVKTNRGRCMLCLVSVSFYFCKTVCMSETS